MRTFPLPRSELRASTSKLTCSLPLVSPLRGRAALGPPEAPRASGGRIRAWPATFRTAPLAPNTSEWQSTLVEFMRFAISKSPGEALRAPCVTALRKLTQLSAADALSDLRVPPGNRLEALKGRRAGQHSIRINDQWRICFEWPAGSPGPVNVEIVDYH